MKNLLYSILILSLTSCMTESKVSKFMRDNKEFSSRECQVLFPIKESSDTTESKDSTDYFWAYNQTMIALDSMLVSFDSLKKKCNIRDTPKLPNIDSIKNAIKKSLTPCVTKTVTITKTKVDTREVERLNIQLDNQRQRTEKYISLYESEKDARIKAEDKLSSAKKKVVMLYSILITVIIVSLIIVFRKFIAPVASGVISIFSKLIKP